MALSNIFREPRREITETVVGIAVFIVLMVLPYFFGSWVGAMQGGPPLLLGAVFGLMLEFAAIALIFFIHFVGEEVCDRLDNHGLELRPRNRR